MNWVYGITTVPSRQKTYLKDTLQSLVHAGFHHPVLFVDGCEDRFQFASYLASCSPLFVGLEIVPRLPAIGVFGNWALGLMELYIRNPRAERYAMFQDDVLLVKNLREYLEKLPLPDLHYWNLYTGCTNEYLIKDAAIGFREAGLVSGGHMNPKREQTGRGALALVFNRDTMVRLLSSPIFVMKPQNPVNQTACLDGTIVASLNPLKVREQIHNPSLAQHIGIKSSIGKEPDRRALSFPGENFDALELLKCKSPTPLQV